METGSLVYETILTNMGDGVVAVDRNGRIVSFNAAAARILDLSETELDGRVFGEVFLLREGLDQFTQTILDAVTSMNGRADRKTVEIEVGGEVRLLTISISYPRAAESAAEGRVGVIAVFTDITEVRELHETEVRLAKKIKDQYTQLQDAYRSIEESNKELAATLRRGRITRTVAVAAVLAVFTGSGYYVWDGSLVAAPESVPAPTSPGGLRTITVEPQRLLTTISVPGRLVARRDTNVASPVAGRVSKLHFRYGDEVEKDQILVTLDISKVVLEHRSVRALHIGAVNRLRELEDWENSRDMATARRALGKAERALETQKHRVAETEFLLGKGIIPASEHEAAVERYESLQLDHEAARQDLLATRRKGGTEAIEVARLEYQNLADQLEDLEEAMAKAIVRAPAGGVVMQPPRVPGGTDGGGRLLGGEEVTRGRTLLTIADVASLSVIGMVDEVEIVNLRTELPVTVTSDAVPGVELQGVVTNVSAQAVNAGAGFGEPALFSVVAAVVEELDPAVRRIVRLGMSADMRIVTRDMPDALLVPIGAVQRKLGGVRTVRVRDRETGAIHDVEVETGTTTREGVEITSGIAPGDQVVVPGGRTEPAG